MDKMIEEIAVMPIAKYFGAATILSYEDEQKTAVLQLKTDNGEFITLGKLVISNLSSPPTTGDIVLAAGNDINSLYIIGLINPYQSEDTIEKVIVKEKPVQLINKKGELIFEYDPETGSSRVNVRSGSLDFITHHGNINFISKRGTIKMSSADLQITNKHTSIKSEQLNYIGDKVSVTVKYSRIIAGKLETIANDIICKTKNLYNSVDELAQLKAGRMRTIIKSTLHMKAKNSYLKSEEDFKINGKKIHLG